MRTFFGVLMALLVAGVCFAGGCLALIAKGSEARKADQDAALSASEIEVKSFDLERSGYATVKGEVRNKGTKTWTYWKAGIRFYDKNQKVVHVDYTNSIQTLRPGETEMFSTTSQPPPTATTVRMTLEEINVK